MFLNWRTIHPKLKKKIFFLDWDGLAVVGGGGVK